MRQIVEPPKLSSGVPVASRIEAETSQAPMIPRVGAVGAIGKEATDAHTTERPRTIGSHDGRTQQRGTVAAAPLDDREASLLEHLHRLALGPERCAVDPHLPASS